MKSHKVAMALAAKFALSAAAPTRSPADCQS
jgi:hypothetical protein